MHRGDVVARYQGGVDLIRLRDHMDGGQAWEEVGRYSRQRHGMLIGGRFSVWHGVAFRLDLPVTFFDRVNWGAARELHWDPDNERPTMAGGSSLPAEFLDATPSARPHSGLGDIGIGLRVVPFAQHGVPGREAAASLAFDVDLRVPSGGSHDRIRDDGSAGPGLGGAGVGFGMQASRRIGGVEPWVALRLVANAPYGVELSDASGEPVDGDVEGGKTRLDPADEVGLRFGTEIHAVDDAAQDRSVRVEVGAGVTYRSAAVISSGTKLPAPLDPSVGHAALSSEHVLLDGAVGLRIRPRAPVEMRVDFGAAWQSPHTLERVDETAYGVQSDIGSLVLSWGFGALLRIR
jgi:hypothetical protein